MIKNVFLSYTIGLFSFSFISANQPSQSPSSDQRRSTETRIGNWDYHQNWQYDREAYLSGETQAHAYSRRHPHGKAGIGYDADEQSTPPQTSNNRTETSNNRKFN